MKQDISERLFHEAQKFIPGGVNSPVRAYKSVDLKPPFIKWAKGSKIVDEDGNEYIDYVGSWGPMILGHANPEVIEAIQKSAALGTTFGAPIESEIKLAKLIVEAFPSVDLVRMVSSGTEATMSAIRLARGYTGRNKIVKFEGCYHGHSDSLLINAGSGALTYGVPSSPGITEGAAGDTIVARYNDTTMIQDIFKRYGEEIAGVIIEPIAGNMGVVPPLPGFLQNLRDITKEYDSLLIFDEVMTGFRVAYGGAQTLYGINGDITCFAKIIGGGLPVGAFGGRRDIMESIAPLGPIYQAGTLSGNPLAMSAGATTLTILKDNPSIYRDLEEKSKLLQQEINNILQQLRLPFKINRVGSMMSLFFTDKEVVDYNTASTSDTSLFSRYFRNMQLRGIYMAPSQFEAIFLSAAHEKEDILWTIQACGESLSNLTNND